jgi:hypothetical protein
MAIADRPALVPEQVYRKLNNDTIEEPFANALLAACAGCTNVDEVRTAFDEFCARHRLKGALADVAGMEHIGHVKPDLTFLSRLSDALSTPEDLLRTHLNALAGLGTSEEARIARVWWDDVVAGQRLGHLSYGSTWLFRSDDEPSEHSPECLPWRLGLYEWYKGPPAAIKCFLFKVRAAELKEPKIPTIFDAGFEFALTVWEPGGLTIPIAGSPALCAAKGGLKEIVVERHPLCDTIGIAVFESAS